MHIGRTRSVSGLGVLSAVCVTGTVLAITLLAAVPAQADTVKFYNGGSGYTGAFSGLIGPATVYSTTQGSATDCPIGHAGCTVSPPADLDILQADQRFLASTIIKATANGTELVWNDLTPVFAGLGVGSDPLLGDTDQIIGTDVLTIHFNQLVTLTGVATLFDPGHNPFGPDTAASIDPLTDRFKINNVSTLLLTANLNGLSLTGHDFTFSQDGSYAPSFYVSALQFRLEPQGDCVGEECGSATPIPGAVWLFGGGVGLIAMFGGRRKRKQKSVWETTTSA